MNIAFDPKYVSKFFSDNGCLLISKYKNNLSKLTYICRCGNIYSQTWRQFKKTKRCKDCCIKNLHGYKLTDDYKKIARVYSKLPIRIFEAWLNTKTTEKLLGYSVDEFYQHIMKSRKNTDKEFVVDHIIPVKAFKDFDVIKAENGLLLDLSIISKINSLDNLQLLSKEENISKGSTYNHDDVINYFVEKNIEHHVSK